MPHEAGVYAPHYYRDFRCIADRCRHSCCVDWEICIDDATLDRYRSVEDIIKTVTIYEDGACFTLTEDGRCPHLDERGLCRIILAHGEEHLSDICRLHPRFVNDVGGGRLELGLGLVCEEACRLILEDERPFVLTHPEEPPAGIRPGTDPPDGFDPLPQRDEIIAALEAPGRCYDDKCVSLKEAFGITDLHEPDEWIDRFLALEILDTAWEETLRAAQAAPPPARQADFDGFEAYYMRLLRYFIYRHVSVAESPEDLRARLAFALLSVDMVRYLFVKGGVPVVEALCDLARRYSAEVEYSEENTDEVIFYFECMF